MSRAGGFGIGLAAAVAVVCCAGGLAVVAVGAYQGDGVAPVPAACTAAGPSVAPAAAGVAGFTAAQTGNATVIVRTGEQMTVPPRGWVIAVATAMQESGLRNSDRATDHDSVGLFQQRPSQGWGTVAQIMDPAYASRKFYERLLQVPSWQSLPLTVAAQRVQRSAFPGAYAKHEAGAARLVDQITGGAANAGSGAEGCATGGEVTASGWVAPVDGATVGSPFGQRGGRLHAGVDLTVPKRTVIRAVADGTVIKAICDPSTQAHGGCDRDGSLSTPGCGWYVDIRHAAGIITRYCHQVVQPLVAAGQHVTAGQQIGWSGTSGHSSGPHLHFEVHTNNDEHAATGAVNPVPFMAAKGVKLDG